MKRKPSEGGLVYRSASAPPQVGASQPFDLLGQVRKLLPFAHGFRANQRDGRGQQISVTFTGAQTKDVTISLGHVPQGYVILGMTAAARLFASAADQAHWTPNNFRIESDAATTANVWVF